MLSEINMMMFSISVRDTGDSEKEKKKTIPNRHYYFR